MKEIEASLKRYIDHKISCGGFLTAVLSNDLFGAVGRADYENVQRIPEIVKYIYNHLPASSYGSAEEVKNWLNG